MVLDAGNLAALLHEEDPQTPVYVRVGDRVYEVEGLTSTDTGGEYVDLILSVKPAPWMGDERETHLDEQCIAAETERDSVRGISAPDF